MIVVGECGSQVVGLDGGYVKYGKISGESEGYKNWKNIGKFSLSFTC